MKQQRFELKNEAIHEKFQEVKKSSPEGIKTRLSLSWSNWGFGLESLPDSAKRLQGAGLRFIELHGNHYGPDLGYMVEETLNILCDHGIVVSGVCGMFSADNEMASNRAMVRQAAIDYLRRELAFTGGRGRFLSAGRAGRGRPSQGL